MKSSFGRLVLGALILLVPTVSAASTLSLDAPVLGYVFDPDTGELRRMDGFPGASSLSAPIDLGFPIMQAVLAPGQKSVIVQDGEGRMLWANLAVTPPTATALEDAMAADGAMFSPSGRRAALYSSATGRLQLLEVVDGRPQLGDEVDSLESIGGWKGFALSDSGTVLAASMREAGGALYMLKPDQLPQRVVGIESLGGLAFFSGSDDAVVADAGANEVLLLRSNSGWWHASSVATVDDFIENPFSVQVTADGRFVAAAVSGGVASVPLGGGVAQFTPCACAPRALAPLAGGNTFLLTEDTSSPLKVIEVGDRSRVLFVPAIPQEIEEISK